MSQPLEYLTIELTDSIPPSDTASNYVTIRCVTSSLLMINTLPILGYKYNFQNLPPDYHLGGVNSRKHLCKQALFAS